MPLPHSVFGSQVHETGKRHFWQRHPLPKLKRMLRRKPAARPQDTGSHREAHVDAFVRDELAAPVRRNRSHREPLAPSPPSPPEPSRSTSPVRAPESPQSVPTVLANGLRDAAAERTLLAYFEDKGFAAAVESLNTAHPTVVLHAADAAFDAGEHDAALKLYALASDNAASHDRVSKYLQRRAGKATERKDASAQRFFLRAWMNAQPNTLQSLSWGCLQACVLNPGITRDWYLRAVKIAKKQDDQAGLDTLSHALLRSLAYAIVINGVPADAQLLQSIQTKDPQLLSWTASGVRAAGNLELADQLERRAQALSAS